MNRRPDLDNKTIAQRWLAGESILDLATDLNTTMPTIRRRLDKARTEFPDLLWDQRQKSSRTGPTQEYTHMTDGKPGAHSIKPGSIIRARRLRGR